MKDEEMYYFSAHQFILPFKSFMAPSGQLEIISK